MVFEFNLPEIMYNFFFFIFLISWMHVILPILNDFQTKKLSALSRKPYPIRFLSDWVSCRDELLQNAQDKLKVHVIVLKILYVHSCFFQFLAKKNFI